MVTLSFLLPSRCLDLSVIIHEEASISPSIELALVSCAQSSSRAFGIESQVSPDFRRRYTCALDKLSAWNCRRISPHTLHRAGGSMPTLNVNHQRKLRKSLTARADYHTSSSQPYFIKSSSTPHGSAVIHQQNTDILRRHRVRSYFLPCLYRRK